MISSSPFFSLLLSLPFSHSIPSFSLTLFFFFHSSLSFQLFFPFSHCFLSLPSPFCSPIVAIFPFLFLVFPPLFLPFSAPFTPSFIFEFGVFLKKKSEFFFHPTFFEFKKFCGSHQYAKGNTLFRSPKK